MKDMVYEPSSMYSMFTKMSGTKYLPYFIIIIGAGLRIAQYMYNRSFWVDEALTALNLNERTFSQLVQPLAYNQAAPVGFLMIEKCILQLCGDDEYALRLFPLLCGIASIPLFYKLAKDILNPKALLFALFLFTLCDSLIYYSSELKPYSSDVFITLVIYTVSVHIINHRLGILNSIFYGGIGSLLIWCSFPAIFVLAGIGTGLFIMSLRYDDRVKARYIILICCILLMSFIIQYITSLQYISNNPFLLAYWNTMNAFIPFPPKSIIEIKNLINNSFQLFNFPGGFSVAAPIAIWLFICGCISFFQDKKPLTLILFSPIVYLLIASAIHKYPVQGRLLLFTVPLIILIVTEGLFYIFRHMSRAPIIKASLISLLLFYPIIFAGYHLTKPWSVYGNLYEVKQAVVQVLERWQDGDILFVHPNVQGTFKYYFPKYRFADSSCIRNEYSTDDWTKDILYLDSLRGHHRVWIIQNADGSNHEKHILAYLSIIGKRLYSHRSYDTLVDLFDLSKL